MLSENIKVSEVSDILRKQLEGIDTRVQLDEIGTVLQVSDGVARIYGLRNAEANELLEFDNGIKAIVMNLEEDNVGAVLLGPTDKIKEGFVCTHENHPRICRWCSDVTGSSRQSGVGGGSGRQLLLREALTRS